MNCDPSWIDFAHVFFRGHSATAASIAIDGRTLESLHSQRDFPQQHVTKSPKYLLLLSRFGPTCTANLAIDRPSGVRRLTAAPVGVMLSHPSSVSAPRDRCSYHELRSAVSSMHPHGASIDAFIISGVSLPWNRLLGLWTHLTWSFKIH